MRDASITFRRHHNSTGMSTAAPARTTYIRAACAAVRRLVRPSVLPSARLQARSGPASFSEKGSDVIIFGGLAKRPGRHGQHGRVRVRHARLSLCCGPCYDERSLAEGRIEGRHRGRSVGASQISQRASVRVTTTIRAATHDHQGSQKVRTGVEFFFYAPIDRSRRALSGPAKKFKIV